MTVSENYIQTVSSGDAVYLQTEAVQADLLDASTQLETVDYAFLTEQLETLNYTALAILFFIVFTWVENRLRSAVRKVMKNGEFN